MKVGDIIRMKIDYIRAKRRRVGIISGKTPINGLYVVDFTDNKKVLVLEKDMEVINR